MTTDRYQRQTAFSGIGKEGQASLSRAAVVQVGCGGLGSVLAETMIRAGVGKLTVIDRDIADITNLHRQFLFDEEDVKKRTAKAFAAAEKLKKIASGAEIRGIVAEFSAVNAEELLSGHDLVLDGTDNMQARYVINDWCVKHDVPWIYGGVIAATGMTMTILPGKGPCLRCLYPETELTVSNTPSTETEGIIATAPAFIALLQATEAIKLLIGSSCLIRGLRIADLWSGDFHQMPISKDPECLCCVRRQFTFL